MYNEVDNDGTIELEVDRTDTTVMTSNVASVSYYERIQWPYSAGVVGTSMTALLDWTGSNDLDMYIINSSGVAVESAESGTRWETDIFRGSGNGLNDVFISALLTKPSPLEREASKSSFAWIEPESFIIFAHVLGSP